MKGYDENWALREATYIAENSNCQSQRGVIIWDRHYGFIAGGVNAPPRPFKCNGSDLCKSQCSKTAVHAEQSALIAMCADARADMWGNYEMLHIKVVNEKAVFSEKPSCWQCSKLILEIGLKYMWLYQKEGLVKYTPLEFHIQTLNNCGLNYIL